MAISDQDKQQMTATASGPNYSSIGQEFSSQLERLKGVQSRQDAYTPQAEQNARAIGDVSDRASGEAPVQIAQQGVALTDRLGQIKEGTTTNILDVISGMMNLQKEKEDTEMKRQQMDLAEREFSTSLAERGLTIGEDGQPRAMTPEEREAKNLLEVSPLTQSYIDLIKNGSIKSISQIPMADRDKVVEELARQDVSIPQLIQQAEGEILGGSIKALYERYGADKGVKKDLSRGRIGGPFTWLGSLVGIAPNARQYNKLKQGLITSIKELVGESGIMTDQDADRLAGLLPDLNSTNKEAKMAWEDVNKFMSGKYGITLFSSNEDKKNGDEYDEADAIINQIKEQGK
jgi:hypothetical protein